MSDREDKIDELREERLQELQEQADSDDQQQAQEELQEQAQQQQEAQKKAMLRRHLTDGARKRLNSVRMSKPDFAEQAERQVLALAQSGRVQGKIDEQQMKQILSELSPDSKKFNINRR